MQVPANLALVVNDLNSVQYLLAQGYKVLLCTEDALPAEILVHPNVIKVSVLLPPYEVVSLESDRQFDSAIQQLYHYLSTYSTAVSLCDIIYITVLKGTPVCLYMGSEYNDLMSVQAIPQFFTSYMGMMFVPYGAMGMMETGVAPRVLTQEYLMGNFTGLQILSFYPKDMDLPQPMLEKLIMELHPPIAIGDYQGANEYFKSTIKLMDGKAMNEYGQKYWMPFTGGPAPVGGNQQ